MTARKVSGSFDLSTGPATSALRDLDRAILTTEGNLEELGRRMDDVVSTENLAELDDYKRKLEDLGRVRSTPEIELKGGDEADARLASLNRKLNNLGRKTATPNIDLKGFDAALAKTELLQQRLSALGRQTARPRVGMGGGAGMVTREVASATSGGGGGFGGLGGYGGLGKWGAIGGGILSAASPLTGGALALTGSAGEGLLGLGGLGVTGGGVASVGFGSIIPTAVMAESSLKKAGKALANYDKQVEISGIHSTQAKTALAEMNQVLAQSPTGTRRLLREYQGLRNEWMHLSKPGQQSITQIGGTALGTARNLAPQFAGIGNSILGQANVQTGHFGQFLEDPRSRNFYKQMGAEATSDLSLIRETGQSVLQTMENIAVAGRPFFHEAVEFIDHWTGGWKEGTNDLGHTREELGKFDEQLKHWGSLTGAGYDLIRDLLSPAAAPGGSMVMSLTHTLEGWDRWINANPAKVSSFYKESVKTVDHIAEALGHISKVLWNLGQLLTPILNDASQFISFASSTGLLTSGGLPFLLAGGAGVRNAQSGWAKRIKGGAATEAMAMRGGAGAARMGASTGGMGLAETGLLLGAGASSAGEARGVFPSRLPFERAPIGESLGFGSTYGLAREAGYGRFAAARAEMGGYVPDSARMIAGDIGKGALSRFLPIAALMGGLQAASFPGGPTGRVEAALSGITAGLIPMPLTGAQTADAATQSAQRVAEAQAHRHGGSISGIEAQIAGIGRRRAGIVPQIGGSGGISGWLEGAVHEVRRIGGTAGLYKDPHSLSSQQKAEMKALELQEHEAHQSLTEAHLGRATQLATGFQHGLGIDLHEGTNPFKVLEKGQGLLLSHLSINHLGREGSAKLADSMLSWARTMKEKNPQLTQPVEEFTKQVEERFKRMGVNVEVVNGHIVEGTTTEWDRIQKVISGASFQALESTSKAFKGIEREALSALRGMGFSPQEARNLFKLKQTNPGLAAEASPKEAKPGFIGPRISQVGEGGKKGHERGGRLPMPGDGNRGDVVPLGGNQFGAGGELMVPRPAEKTADMLLSQHGTSLAHILSTEGLPHNAMPGIAHHRSNINPILAAGPIIEGYEYGGRLRRNFAFGGRLGSVEGEMQRLAAMRLPYVWGGGHSGWSRHPTGLDCSGSVSYALHAGGYLQTPETSGTLAHFGEAGAGPLTIFANPSHTFMYDARKGMYWGTSLSNPRGGPGWIPRNNFTSSYLSQFTKRHPAGLSGVGAAGFSRGIGGMAGAAPSIHLNAPGVRGGGTFGALVNSASHGFASGLEQHVNRALARTGGFGLGSGGSFGGSRSGVERAIATDLMRHGANRIAAAGIIGNAWRESKMDPTSEGTGGGGLWGFTSGAISLANLKKAGGGQWGNPAFQTNFMLAHGGQSLLGELNRAHSPEEAARLFMEKWEKPGIPALSEREAGAAHAFKQGFTRGGRLPGFAGWYGTGGSGIADKPMFLGVGDKPEEVSIRPLHHQRPVRHQRPIIQIKVDLRGAHIQGKAHAKKIAKEMSEQVSAELVLALQNNDGVAEEDLTG